MKKLIMIVMLVLSLSMVSAQGIRTIGQTQNMIQEQIENIMVYRNSSVDGLEKAQIRVTENVDAETIDRIMEKTQERNRLLFQNMENVSLSLGEGENVIAHGREEAELFGFINIKRESNFLVNEEGDVERISRPLDFLFRYQQFEE